MSHEAHPYSTLMPNMTDSEFGLLCRDIAQNQCLVEKIVLYQDKVLDGRHREKACEQVGVKPEYEAFKGSDEEALNFVISKGLPRRNLVKSQIAMILAGARLKRQQINGHADETATTDGQVSDRLMDYATQVIKHGVPELQQAVQENVISVADAAHASELPRSVQKKVVSTVRSGKADTAKKAIAAIHNKEANKGDAHEEDEEPTEELVDDMGRAVPTRLRDAFGTTLLVDAARDINRIKNLLKGCREWHPFLLDEITTTLGQLSKTVFKNTPAVVCSRCEGKGCKDCRKAGWLPKWRAEEELAAQVVEVPVTKEA